LTWIIQLRPEIRYPGFNRPTLNQDQMEDEMTSLTQPLRDEHRELFPHIAQLKTAADLIGQAEPRQVIAALEDAGRFLNHHLLPHAQAEDAALYPAVARLLGGPQATDSMKRDHTAVHELIEELADLSERYRQGELSGLLDNSLRGVLYGLYTLVSVHFAKEEEIYLPLLDAGLTPGEATGMFERLEAAAAAAHRVMDVWE
jgi:iron-sulfur cluster repair protein YtfE (RIC family)